MADSKRFMLRRRIFLLSVACSLLALCVVAAAAPALADHDPSMVCLHRASTGEAYDGVVPLKDGSGRLLCWKRDGQVWLSAGTTTGSGYVLQVGGKAMIDLRTRVSQDSARGRGLAGVAVDSSSRLFVSYYTTTTTGGGGGGGGAFLVVDQVSASLSEHEAPTTTRRVFSMALPEPNRSSWGFPLDYYGGQIMFRPTTTDPNLYLVTGPAQTDGQLQAKILRFPVGQANGTVTATEYASMSGVPRGCSFDADRPHDLYCAIVVEDEQEQVYLVSDPDAPSYAAPAPIASLLVAYQRPIPETPPSLVGGLLYRGDTDTTLVGSYINMHGSEFWVTVPASPARNPSTNSRKLRVTSSGGGDFAAGGGITSFGEDEGNNALLLATDGVYLVVGPQLCDTDNQGATSTNKLLKTVGIILGAILALLGGSYLVHRCSCFNRKNEININAPNGNVNIFNGNHGKLTVNN